MILDEEVKHEIVNNRDLDIYTYRKEGSSVSMDDYFALLNEYLSKDNMSFDYAYYKYENDSGYTSSNTIYNIKNLNLILSSYLYRVDSFFKDDERNYKLSFSPMYDKNIQLVTSKRIDLENRKKM